MKIVFMGTPDFSVGILEALLQAGHEVTAVVTQPDKQKGRGKGISMPPVKAYVQKNHPQIPVFQPAKIKAAESVAALAAFSADVFVVAAFGQILSKEILEMPRLGCVNVHASLLPKYRGAAPIQWSIIDGETETGITIMQMNEGMDTGDILSQSAVPIAADETGDSLFEKLCREGAALCVTTLAELAQGSLTPVPQDSTKATYARRLEKSLGHLKFGRPAAELERLVRGLNSWPGAYSYYHGKVLKIWKAEVRTGEPSGLPGTIHSVEKDAMLINTGGGLLAVLEMQLEGKKRLPAREFLLGCPVQPGEALDN